MSPPLNNAVSSANPLKNKQLFKLLTYRVLMVLAYQIMAVVVGWHIYEITHDPLALGLIGLAELIPYFAFALFGGYLVDHYSKRLFGVLSAIILSANACILAYVSSNHAVNNASHWIYLSIAFVGFARAFIAPTYSTIFASILPRELYARATSVGTTIFQIGLVLGPALGGAIIAWGSLVMAYIVASLLAFFAGISLISLKIESRPLQNHTPIFASISEGIKFVMNNQVILGAQALDMFAVLFGGAVAMLPMFVTEVFNQGPQALGIMRAAPAAGAILTGICLAKFTISKNAGRWLMLAVAGFGISIIAFACTTHFWLAVFLLFLSGAFDGVSIVLRTTIMQLMTPEHMRGRVASINGLFIGSSNELGAFESGSTARIMGLIPSVIFGGVMTLIVVAATAKLAPKLRKLDLTHH